MDTKLKGSIELSAFPGVTKNPSNRARTFGSHRLSFANANPTTGFGRRSSSAKAGCKVRAIYTPQNRETLYEMLGIAEGGTLLEIKKAYKQLARKYHPDVSPPERTEEYTKKFIMVQEAYETLSDPETRVMYDHDLAGGLSSSRRRSCYDDNQRTSYEWRKRWESQLDELSMRRRKSKEKMSWGASMRRQRDDMFHDLASN